MSNCLIDSVVDRFLVDVNNLVSTPGIEERSAEEWARIRTVLTEDSDIYQLAVNSLAQYMLEQ